MFFLHGSDVLAGGFTAIAIIVNFYRPFPPELFIYHKSTSIQGQSTRYVSLASNIGTT
ncbi:hypothetical protein [uncultured Flavobacterium sp.]|uniref:hypothetical protein n=1 Tax=uncultured Flavobacterium sp. TaxID=165435 RepID=UPI0025FED829|nr:hypothetical protein [uncultured Flavobacterium sp.]